MSFVKRDQGFMKWFSKKTNLQWFNYHLPQLNNIRFLEEWVSNISLSNKGRIDYGTISRCITIKNESQRMLGGKYFYLITQHGNIAIDCALEFEKLEKMKRLLGSLSGKLYQSKMANNTYPHVQIWQIHFLDIFTAP